MIRFNSDYTEGCHPAILERLAATNMEQTQDTGRMIYYCGSCGADKRGVRRTGGSGAFSGGRNTDECDSDFGCIKDTIRV